MNRITLAAATTTLMILLTGTLSGCYSPKGGLIPHTGGPETYLSPETMPVTIVVRDLRSGETVFTMDVPGGKQLTLQFFQGRGDDPVYSPDLMKYAVLEYRASDGQLSSSLTVPPAHSRRIDVYYRDGVEYTPAPPDEIYRTDQISTRPDWWTPAGGPMPQRGHAATTMYDN